MSCIRASLAQFRQTREEGILSQLMGVVGGPLLGYFQKALGHRLATHVAEDLIQETWMLVVEKIDQFDPDRGGYSWILLQAQTAASEYLRRQKAAKRGGGQSLLSLEVAGTVAGEEEPVDARLERAEDHEFVRGLLANLPDKDRQIVEMFFFEGLTKRRIAEILGITFLALKGRLIRICERMGRQVQMETT